MSTTASWESITDSAIIAAQGLGEEYVERLNFELKEIDKQGANQRWINYVIDGKKFGSNPKNLVFPWLLGMVEEDPIANRQ